MSAAVERHALPSRVVWRTACCGTKNRYLTSHTEWGGRRVGNLLYPIRSLLLVASTSVLGGDTQSLDHTWALEHLRTSWGSPSRNTCCLSLRPSYPYSHYMATLTFTPHGSTSCMNPAVSPTPMISNSYPEHTTGVLILDRASRIYLMSFPSINPTQYLHAWRWIYLNFTVL